MTLRPVGTPEKAAGSFYPPLRTAPHRTTQNPTGQLLTQLGMFAILGLMFYMLMIRPQQKKAKEHASLLSTLRAGDKVVTHDHDRDAESGECPDRTSVTAGEPPALTLQEARVTVIARHCEKSARSQGVLADARPGEECGPTVQPGLVLAHRAPERERRNAGDASADHDSSPPPPEGIAAEPRDRGDKPGEAQDEQDDAKENRLDSIAQRVRDEQG